MSTPPQQALLKQDTPVGHEMFPEIVLDLATLHAYSYRRTIFLVTYRRIFAFALAFLWLAAPLLACLPNRSMTAEEMECCKRMAGNCDMGGGNHGCCDKTVNHSAPTAALLYSSTFDLHGLVVCVSLAHPIVAASQFDQGIHSPFVSASPPPLALSSVLRI